MAAAMFPSIRPMQSRDLRELARLRRAAFFEGSGRTLREDIEGLRALLDDGSFELGLVADLDSLLAGSALFVRSELEPPHDLTPWLAGLVVAPDHRRRGIGRALVMAIEAHAATVGCQRLHLYTNEAEAFYRTLGWKVAERFVQDGEPTVLMTRLLGVGSE